MDVYYVIYNIMYQYTYLMFAYNTKTRHRTFKNFNQSRNMNNYFQTYTTFVYVGFHDNRWCHFRMTPTIRSRQGDTYKDTFRILLVTLSYYPSGYSQCVESFLHKFLFACAQIIIGEDPESEDHKDQWLVVLRDLKTQVLRDHPPPPKMDLQIQSRRASQSLTKSAANFRKRGSGLMRCPGIWGFSTSPRYIVVPCALLWVMGAQPLSWQASFNCWLFDWFQIYCNNCETYSSAGSINATYGSGQDVEIKIQWKLPGTFICP